MRKLTPLLFLVACYLLLVTQAQSAWNSFLGDNRNSATFDKKFSSLPAGEAGFEFKWRVDLPGSYGEIPYNPIADDNGNIFVPREKGIYAYDKDGNELWKHIWESSTNKVSGSLALVESKVIYSTNGVGGYIAALDKSSGNELWKTRVEAGNDNIIFTTSPASSPDGLKIYINNFVPGKIYAFNSSDGSLLSSHQFLSHGKPFYSSIAVSSSGVVYTATSYGHLLAFNGATLETIWSTYPAITQKGSATTPTLSFDLTKIFIAINQVEDGKPFLYALNIGDGSKLWEYKFTDASEINSSPTESLNGNIYLNAGNSLQTNKLYAFDSDGSILWKKEYPFGVQTSISSDGNSQIYVNTDDLYVLSESDGSQVFTHDLDNEFNRGAGSNVVLATDGTDSSSGMMYVVDSLGALFAFKTQIPTEKDTDSTDDTDGSTPTCTKDYYCDSAPKHNPVLFVHGMGGKPEEWIYGEKRAYRDKLLTEFRKDDPEFPDDWLDSYHFGFLKDGRYDYQGDIKEMASGMSEKVGQLSNAHKEHGGDGKVDLVGFSLGGMVIRQYLAENPTDHKARKAILMASPHKGSWLMGVDQDVYSIPVLGKWLEEQLSQLLLKKINEIKGDDQPISNKSKTARQLTSNSDYLEGSQKLNDPKNTPKDIEYYLHSANILMRARHEFLFWTLEKEASIGDGVVLEESALGMPFPAGRDAKRITYGGTNTIKIHFDNAKIVYAYSIDIPKLDSWKLLHTEFDKYPELVNNVVEEILD